MPFALDAFHLARAQFAFTVSFHFIFPAFSIGLASYLAVLEGLWLWTKQRRFIDLNNYWLKIFAVSFGMGVVTGIVMSFQFGTNWAILSDKAGNVLGLMPHPERVVEKAHGGTDGRRLFEGLLETVGA